MDNRQSALKAIAAQTAEVTTRVSRLAGRTVVMQKFIDIALPTLTSAQAAEIHQQLRETLEDVMALMDDALLPPDYHSAFLDKTNELLCALARNIAADASSRRA